MFGSRDEDMYPHLSFEDCWNGSFWFGLLSYVEVSSTFRVHIPVVLLSRRKSCHTGLLSLSS